MLDDTNILLEQLKDYPGIAICFADTIENVTLWKCEGQIGNNNRQKYNPDSQ